MPILGQFKYEHGGDKVEGYHVAYLHARSGAGGTAGAASGPGADIEGMIDLSKTSLDIVFVLDTTASMQPFIDATRRVVADVASKVTERKLKIPVRFGLVAYRDTIRNPPPDWYVTRVVCDLKTGSKLDAFLKALEGTREATVGSEDTPEDVLAGLKRAIADNGQEIGWNPDAFRNVVLIGDASAHLEDAKNSEKLTIEEVLALAQPTGRDLIRKKIAIHTVRIVGEDWMDHKRCEEQFARIAQGRDYRGEVYQFDGSGTPAFVNSLVEMLVRAASGLDLGKFKGPAAVPKNTPALGLLLDMLAASGADTGDAGADVPTFASGYTGAIDRKGNLQVEPYVLVQFGQLDLFRSSLDFCVKAMREAGDPGARDVNRIVNSLQMLATQVNMGEPVKPDTPLAEILNYVLGFPVRSKIFEMTPAKLATMTAADFEGWVKQVEACENSAKGHIESEDAWFSLGKEADPRKRFGFIKIMDLP